MILWLLRHGDALHPAGTSDAERPLSAAGRQQARAVGQFIAHHHIPGVVLCSPLVRARETASIVAASARPSWPVESTSNLLSGATPSKLLTEVNKRSEECILLVGHEPLMSVFASHISSGHSTSVMRFSPCTLALLRTGGRLRADGAILELLVPPDLLIRKSGHQEKSS